MKQISDKVIIKKINEMKNVKSVMSKLFASIFFALITGNVSFSQITINAGNDTTICLGTDALLTAVLSDKIGRAHV